MLDSLFACLANENRRELLFVLSERDHGEQVDAVEGASCGERAQSDLQKMLHHRHLPMLEAEGFVDWDRESQEVTRGPKFGEVEPVVESVRDCIDW